MTQHGHERNSRRITVSMHDDPPMRPLGNNPRARAEQARSHARREPHRDERPHSRAASDRPTRPHARSQGGQSSVPRFDVAIEGVSGPSDYRSGARGRRNVPQGGLSASPHGGKVLGLAIIAILLAVAIWAISAFMPHDRIPDGIRVGELDVSGMTASEASAAIDDMYLPRLNATTVYVFADEETAHSADVDLQMIESEAQAEQLSFEEAQRNKRLWIASAESMGARLPSDELAQTALDLGNSLGFLGRLMAGEEELTVSPKALFDGESLNKLISDINSSLGSPVVDYGLDIGEDGIAIIEGSDGYLLDDSEFEGQLSDVLLVDESELQGFVADVRETPYLIDANMAAATKNAIETRIPESVEFDADGKAVTFDRSTLMGWVSTRPAEADGAWYLEPYLDSTTASVDILKAVNIHGLGEDVNVTFDVREDGSVEVVSSKDVSLPDIDGALQVLDDKLFGPYRASRDSQPEPEEMVIDVKMSEGKSQFTLEEALSYGLVTEISSFTTQYATTTSTLNRRDNIHLVSDAINKTVVAADGGEWSFLDHAGSMEEEDGYKEAGVIVSGKMDQGVGGGVCQVATTVFNAVYQAGLGFEERHNHTLYSSSYPAGLDAAVASPNLDLVWSNPTSSDILLVTSYTDYSVTVTLIGIDPEFEVITERGDWEDGKEHTTEYEIDENLRPGASYVKTAPTDGMQIGVTRIVNDKDGNMVDTDMFYSIYAPVNRVIAYGKGSDLSEIKAKYAEEDDD